MKRSPLERKSALGRGTSRLSRKTRLRAKPKPRVDEPGRDAWKKPVSGYCTCGGGKFSLWLHRHHVYYAQHVRVAGGDPWDLTSSMLLHPDCHRRHHDAVRRIPLASVPDVAIAFAVDLIGEQLVAALYFARYYRATPASVLTGVATNPSARPGAVVRGYTTQ